ncbi:hypothetical protein D8674_036005 [Pyrus ussuriensis x Pyrus communis]|uniref:Uncharacterized protein n=1 Tax=Pyrus ussuriensis x Pyrus communis TaxID=2448454 RepID=A0A5N5GDY5_9ROSA|nr:hypothetical protein D8674_036005 [Pyrus ussuriensis x Pyrus communis]
MNNATSNGNCIQMKEATGMLASKMIGITTIIMVAIDKKRVKRPIIIFVGNDLRKSSSE